MIPAVIKYHAAAGPKKWVLWVAAAVSVFIAVALIYIRLNRRKQEIEKLRNQADIAAAKAQGLRHTLSREKDHGELRRLLDTAQALHNTAVAKRQEIAVLQQEFAVDYARVKALESWKDLDAHNQKLR